jgi:hypothetical protein
VSSVSVSEIASAPLCLPADNNDTNGGQVADLLTNTFTVANTANRTVGVASAVGGALAAVSSSVFSVLANETVKSINDLVHDAGCSVAATTAIGEWTLTLFFLVYVSAAVSGFDCRCGRVSSWTAARFHAQA